MTVGISMFIILIVLIIIGFPISFAMALAALVALTMGGYAQTMLATMTIEGVNSYILLAVPFFILAGNLMNSTGITKRIFDFSNALFGHFLAGLAHVNVVASMIFAGISGTSIGDQAGLGSVEIKAMTEKGYDKAYSIALALITSVLGSIIPPSVSLIVYGTLADVSIIKLFTAGVIPGVLIAIVLMCHIYFTAKMNWIKVPPKEPFEPKSILKTFKDGFFALLAPVVILAGMLGGVVTPTEAGVIAVLYALFCGAIYKELKWENIKETIKSSVISTSLIMFLVGVGKAMGWVASAERLPALISDTLLGITDNKIIMLLIINVMLLFLGTIMEGVPIKLMLVPILLPIIDSLGIDRLHFGIVMSFNILIGMATPPVGLGLYVMSHIGNLSVAKITRAVIPLYIPLIIALLILTFVPSISLWLPNLLFD